MTAMMKAAVFVDKGRIELAGLFRNNFQKYADGVSVAVRDAGPRA